MLLHVHSALANICVQVEKCKYVEAEVNAPIPSKNNSWILLTYFYVILSDKFKKDIRDSLNIVAKWEFWGLLVQTHHTVQNVNQSIFKYIIEEHVHKTGFEIMIIYIHIETEISHSQFWLHIIITRKKFCEHPYLASLSLENLFNLVKSGH